MRKDAVFPCLVPVPSLPALPNSITQAYGFDAVVRFLFVAPKHAMKERCSGCPLYEPRPKGGAS